MKRSEMAWIAWDTTNVTCSKNIISLDFFEYFLCQDNCAAINEAKNNNNYELKSIAGLGWQPQEYNL